MSAKVVMFILSQLSPSEIIIFYIKPLSSIYLNWQPLNPPNLKNSSEPQDSCTLTPLYP